MLEDRPADRTEVRDRNQSVIFATILRADGPISRVEVANQTGLSQATVTKVVKDLLKRNLLIDMEVGPSGRVGRPVRYLKVNEDERYAVGVRIKADELGGPGGDLTGVVTNLGARVIARESFPFRSKNPQAVVRDVADLAGRLLAKRPNFRSKAIGLGVELGGHIDNGEVRFSPNLNWHSNVSLSKLLEDATGLRTVVENDVNALAVHEQLFGAGRRHRSFVVIWVGDGIGSGLVFDNQVVRGASGGAGEIGHLPVKHSERKCRCGADGCLETVATIAAILQEVRGHPGYGQVSGIQDITSLARKEDPVVGAALERGAMALARAVASAVNLLNPSHIVFTGPAVVSSTSYRQEPVLFSDRFMEVMTGHFRRHSYPSLYKDCQLEVKWHAVEDSAQGAASIVLRDFIVNPLPGG